MWKCFSFFFSPLENIPSLHPVKNGWRLQVGDQAYTPTSKLCLEEAICYPGGIYHNIPPPCKLFIWRSGGTKSICWVIGRTWTVHLPSAVPLWQCITHACVYVCVCGLGFRGLFPMVRVSVCCWVIHYADESPHKSRSARLGVCSHASIIPSSFVRFGFTSTSEGRLKCAQISFFFFFKHLTVPFKGLQVCLLVFIERAALRKQHLSSISVWSQFLFTSLSFTPSLRSMMNKNIA